MQTIRAFVWDVDGVFVDTERLHFEAWQRLVRDFGKDLFLNEYLSFVGRGSDENMKVFCEMKNIEGDVVELNARRRGYYAHARAEGVPVLRDNVRLAQDFKIAYPELRHMVASSARRSDVEENICTAGLLGCFAPVVSFEDQPHMKRKPAPDIYLYAASKAGLVPGECLAFEDSRNGVIAAKGAGMFCVALPNGLTLYQDLSMADFIIPFHTTRNVREIVGKIEHE